MKAYMVQSEKKIEPFGDHPRDCLIGNRRLGDIQSDVLRSLGLALIPVSSMDQVDDTDEHIVFCDSLLFSRELLREFIKKSRKSGQATVCATPPPDLAGNFQRVVTTQDVRIHSDRVEYNLHYVPAEWSRQDPLPLMVDVEKHFVNVPIPEHAFGCREVRLPFTDRILFQIDHWVNLHNANIAMTAMRPATLWDPYKYYATVLKARSFNDGKVGRHFNKMGKKCKIHPTAWVEYSILGDNVQVGAGSILSGALVGDGTFIENQVNIQFSVVGERCLIGSGNSIRYAVLYPGAVTVANTVQYSLCGRDTFLGGGVALLDYRFDGRCITVMKDGQRIDTNSRVLGACLGHGVYLGLGCIVLPGRAVPNGLRLVPGQLPVINRLDSGGNMPGYYQVNPQP